MRIAQLARTLVLLGFSATLSACGDGGGVSSGSAADTRGVIASASDCVSFGPGAVEACSRAIERAVASHEAAAASYSNLQACESTVGEGRCERAESGHYRIRLSAFIVSMGAQPHAEPLYPAKDGAVGFQTASRDIYLASDQSIAFSRLALSVAETQAAPDTKGRRRSKL